MSDVMGGQVQFMFYHPAAVMPQIKAGKLRALGASSAQAQRRRAATCRPSWSRACGDFDLVAWFMLYAPAATPAPVLARLREAAGQALASTDVATSLRAQGLELRCMQARRAGRLRPDGNLKWSELVKRSGAQVD